MLLCRFSYTSLIPDLNLRWTTLFCGVYLQGGNNIHEEGISKIAQALKDNDAVTTVSHLAFKCLTPIVL